MSAIARTLLGKGLWTAALAAMLTLSGCGGGGGDAPVPAPASSDYSIAGSAAPTEGGSVTGGGGYNLSEAVTLTASANNGYSFVNWTEGGTEVSTSANYTFSASADRTLVANFSINSYSIGASAAPVAGGSVTGGGSYKYNTQVTLTASASNGYNFVNWTEGGTEVSTSASYVFAATTDRTLVATFGRPLVMQSFTKTSESTLAWSTTGAASCEITNDQNGEVLTVAADSLTSGKALHPLPAGTTFTLTCQGETGTTGSLSATTVGTNPFPQTMGYYGSASSLANSWVAIVNLTTPIGFTDMYDFNAQVDSYCSTLGYVGAAKTKSGAFSTHATYYLHSGTGVIGVSAPSTASQVTVIPAGATYTNVYTNASHYNNSWGNVARASIGNNAATKTATTITSPTSGVGQMVLCQTDISFRNTTSLAQSISFADPGPIRKVQGLDTSFVNIASGGQGLGAITYVSSNPAVAAVDASTGSVTLVGLGTTTITATKAADAFVGAQASYTLTVDSPQPTNLQSFTKTSSNTISWTTGVTGTLSCEITNDQNTEVLKVTADSLTSGTALHPLPVGATFTITCQGEDGSSATLSATTVGTNPFPQTVGYYGSASSMDNSWVAIVNLTTPITFTDGFDFNSQVENYCTGLGYVGAAKTKTGDFSTHDTYYLQTAWAVITGNGPSKKVTHIPGDATFTNIYANETNYNTWPHVERVTIGNNSSSGTSISSPTSGVNQMVLCQTNIKLGNTTSLPQTISFSEPGPLRKVQGVDEPSFVNAATGGLGSGAITYVSSDPAVATVDATTGTVTLLTLGTTTITATKASDLFVEAQASYTLTVDSPQPIDLQSFTKTSDNTLSWTTGQTGTLSCEITNDQNSEVLNVTADSLTSGTALHHLQAGATFTITCQGEDGTSATLSATTVGTNPFPQTVGYYGSPSSIDNSWVAIVNLTTPIDFTDGYDFNAKVDAFCTGLGYVGAVKTKTGDFSLHDTHYLYTGYGVVSPSPSTKVTVIPGDLTFSNIYSNRAHTDGYSTVIAASIGNNSVLTWSGTASPTSGVDQMVLCQTDIKLGNTTSLPQTISFADPGPFRKVQGLDTTFVNTASGGLGTGAITYVSSDPAVATVDATTGTVTVVGLGTATITATKAADAFVGAQASYTLTVDSPQPLNLTSFIKSTDTTLHWAMDFAVSCEITNSQNTDVISIAPYSLASGGALHALPTGTTFTLTCQDETGAVTSQSVTTVVTNQFPQTAGYYGSANSANNSWVAIVNLTSPITFADGLDFNAQADSYCAGLGYVGVVKTKNGAFATHDTFYLHAGSLPGITWVWEPSKQATVIPGDVTLSNIYTNGANHSSYAQVIRTSIGNNASVDQSYSVASPTSGVNPMVLCQTDIPLQNTKGLLQTISFPNPGPIRKVQGMDASTFTNRVSDGLGLGAVTYVSSNPAVATVNANGTVTLVGLGTTTITATKAADAFVEAQASYTLTVDIPRPVNLKGFIKSTDNTLRWSTDFAVSCEITNNQNSEVITLSGGDMSQGNSLHTLPAGVTFTLTCQGEDGTTSSTSVSTVTNLYPQTMGYYGSTSSQSNSWVAIVNLTTPIGFTDMFDFNAQVDSYCSALGYVGAAKTKSGAFSTHATYYLHSGTGVTGVSAPTTASQVTVIPADATYTNVYTNASHYDSSLGYVARASIGHNAATNTATSITGPTSGVGQMVLCQTDILFKNSALLPQAIGFAEPGPIRRVVGIDTSYSNTASGGKGTGAITYTSSNPSVATVDAITGDVTLLSMGSTTITATKAADTFFQQAKASYVLNFDTPMNLNMQSFTKTDDYTLAWTIGAAVSCNITNDQNTVVTPITLNKQANGIATGRLMHGLPAATAFTVTCNGETGTTGSLVASAGINPFPQTVGYYGSANSVDNSWVAIVNLTTPIGFTDMYDFNAKVDSYCTGLGYVGAAKTKSGTFSTHATYYLHSRYGITGISPPSNEVTLIPGDATYTNVYTNQAHTDVTSWGQVVRASVGNNNATNVSTSIISPTSGVNQMVLCQTDTSFRETVLLTQTVSFTNPGPVFKTLGVDIPFTNAASGSVVSTPITYVSSNPGVATVDANGTVTLVSVGTITITATINPAFGFIEAQASYTLDVQ